jgi:hypothetical protein
LYATPNIIRVIISKAENMGRACSKHGRDGNAYKIFVGKPEGKRSLRGSRRIWEDNIRLDLWETEWEGVNWMHLAQDRDHWLPLLNMVVSFWVP